MTKKKTIVFSVVGYKNSGKTTLIEKLIAHFKSNKKRVGVIKHDVHKFEIDHQGKDTYRFSAAGADRVLISAKDKFAMICHTDTETDIEELISRTVGGVDILITEGYKNHPFPKIEVTRAKTKEELLLFHGISNVNAVVSDEQIPELNLPLFKPTEIKEIAEFIMTMKV